MTRNEQLSYCKICENKKFNPTKGIVCKLTNELADFDKECKDFVKNEELSKNEEEKTSFNLSLIKPNYKRAKYAEYLIITIMLLNIVAIISSYMQYDLLTSFQNGQMFSDDTINANDTREQIIGIIMAIVNIISIITFVQWFRRAYFNLNQRIKCSHKEGWALGSWFVPIVSLFRPYQIMKEMDTEVTEMINKRVSESKQEKNNYLMIGFWWALWIISSYIGRYATKGYFKAEEVDDFINVTIADITLSIIGIPLAIITIFVIRNYSEKEELLVKLEKKE